MLVKRTAITIIASRINIVIFLTLVTVFTFVQLKKEKGRFGFIAVCKN